MEATVSCCAILAPDGTCPALHTRQRRPNLNVSPVATRTVFAPRSFSFAAMALSLLHLDAPV
jgi:hypothetical protein